MHGYYGGRCHGKAMVREREDVQTNNNLKAFLSFGSLIFCTSLMQDATTAIVKEKRLAEKKTEKGGRAAG
ncbi:hypothetical protein PFLUV_G00200040 [Perca fluviatilis]|uniref:Uncharacterized protein n=1 Tax=Perca fluviatilis TaxID=8168 RepID=A0A6A5DTV6_PERFL|nr:hypothetical protein PFLUV_G00200040 [Perca fluviatilis]